MPLPSAVLRAWLSVAFVAAGASCTSVDSADPKAWQLPQAMVLSPGWVTGTTWPAETVVALRSVALRGTALVDGDLTVITAGTGPFLSGTSELSIATNAEITGNVRADSIDMQVAGHILGTANYNQLTGSGTIDGAQTPSLTVPVPRTVVAAVNFTAGTSNITVNAGSTSTQGSGSYGLFDVKTGTAAARSLLRIRSGATVNVNNIVLGDFARIECLGPCEIRVKNRITAGPRSYIGPASGQTMDRVKLFVEGINGGAGGPNDLPAAAGFGQFAELKAHTFVPNGTLSMGPGSNGVGKFIARDVDVATDAELMSGSSTQRVQALRYVVGPSWPSQTLLAWNSLDILSSTSLTGDGAVLQNGTGPFLNTSEAVIGTTATLTGNLSADRVELKTGSSVTGTVRHNTIVNAGMAGALVTPLTLPLDLRVPVFPNITTNSTNYTLAATADATLAAGRFRNVTLTSGTSVNKSVLTLSGGLYEMRTLTVGSNCSIVCTAACELRVSKNVVTGDASSLGPAAALDVSKVKLFVSQTNSLPTSTPFAVSFGTNNQVSAFVFAPAGTLEAKGGSSVRGRFVARDIRIGSGSMAEVAGTTLIAPSISQQPVSVTVLAGQPATFSVVAAGSDIAFQWLRDGMAIAGATGGSYTIPATVAADRGAVFTVTVSNSLGSISSSMATLTVDVCDPATYTTVSTSCGLGACLRMGTSSCVSGLIIDTCMAGTPAATDASCNGVDEDCDGLADDGYVPMATTCAVGACAATGVTSCVAGMVRNSCTSSTPAADDATCDGRDDDCDGRTDENFPVMATTCGAGACAEVGVTSCVGGAAVDSCVPDEPGPSDTSCNGIDDDCNGEVDDDFNSVATSCGVGACATTGMTACVAGDEIDTCVAGTNSASDATCDGVDDDCSGTADEDYAPVATSCGVGACGRTGATSCVAGSVANSCVAGTPAAIDATCNGVDDDCSGTADEDYASLPTSCGVGACVRSGVTSCVAGSVANSCVAGAPAASDATCNGVDDDCSGAADEDYSPVATSCGVGACVRAGVTSCVSGSVASSCVAGTPAANDAICNGIDDDCSGAADEDYAPSATSCGVGACARSGATSCVAGSVANSCVPGTPAASDATCNGVDDDCSGAADEDYSAVATSCGVGACAATGVTSCVSGGVANSCVAGTPAASDATCNATDDDCSGSADEDYVPLATSCGVGTCSAAGVTSCVSGSVGDSCVVPTADTDFDGTPDCADGCPTDPAKLAPGGCGCGVTDLDSDFDGALDCAEACPLDPLDDVDGDGLCGDVDPCPAEPENDVDGDGLCPADDNCPSVANPDQLDADDDGAGDACDALSMLAVSSGGDHSCALMQLGGVRCWGGNSLGQLGDGTTIGKSAPTAVSGLSDATEVSAGFHHTCALRAGQQVACWGEGAVGRLGNGGSSNSSTPVTVSGLTDAVEVDAARDHSCARRATGQVVCWGANASGQLGNATTTSSLVPVLVSGLTDAVQLAVGQGFSCARRSSGAIACWGRGDSGQLGRGTITNSNVPVPVTGIADAAELAAGDFHACTRRIAGEVRCWGYGANGQLGDGFTTTRRSPVVVLSLTSPVELDAGRLHTCARLSSGELRCWGDNAYGQLGNGSTTSATTPSAVSGISDAVQVSAGDLHTCARRANSEVLCWGQAVSGQLGQGGAGSSATASPVAGISTATEVAAGSFHSCARHANGSASCWGPNQYGELGTGTGVNASVPAAVFGLSDALSLAAGDTHSCAVRSGGGVECWGYGGDGALGNGSTGDALAPVAVSGLNDAATITAGNWHSCAVRDGGSVVCWGVGVDGELGDGTFASSTTPVTVSGLSDAVYVAGGGAHSCALRATGAVVCWGYDGSGQLGNGAGGDSGTPVPVVGITDGVWLGAGSAHSCVVHATGAVSCWGANWEGQLGDGSKVARATPVPVLGLSAALQVDAGSDHTCALRANGDAVCWGANADKQLGNGTSIGSSVPVTVVGLANAVSVSAGYAHSCGVSASGAAKCWGDGSSGQLGNGYPQSPVPVRVNWP